MIKRTILGLMLLSFTISQAQISNNLDNNGMQIYTKSKTPTKYTGSPYAEKDFKRGIIIDKNKNNSQPALLRYNAVEDVVEIRLKEGDKSSVLPKFTHLTYDMGDYNYFIGNLETSSGNIEAYFAEYYKGDKSQFVGRPVADVTPAKPANTGYEKDKPANLKVEMVYYISLDNGVFKEVRLKNKDIEDLFTSEKMSKYLDKNKIKDEKDVVEMLKVYETI